MPSHAHLDGPALRALAADAAPFVPPPEPVGTERDRVWDLAETLHCSLVGTCLTNAEARGILAKLGRPDAHTMSEHRLHGEIVQIAGRRDGGARLLQKALDRRHAREIARFEAARTAEAVRALWKASLEAGEIPGAYWAAITHPATDWALVQEVFGEVHMLSHLVGQSNRADIRRLRHLEAELERRDEALSARDARILDLMRERDDLSERARAAAPSRPVPPPKSAAPQEAFRILEARLVREAAHAARLEERVAVLSAAAARLAADLEAETERRTTAEAEAAALEAALDPGPDDAPAAPIGLAGHTILYVGGRPRHVAGLRRFVEGRGGRLLAHDGGVEESLGLLPGLAGQADVAVFPVTCISHEASLQLKRHCEAAGTPYRPLRSASLAGFVRVLSDLAPAAG